MPVADVRFIRPGISKIYFVATIANPAAPTAAEVNAGVNLSATVADVVGFTYQNTPVSVLDWGDNFESKVIGLDVAAQSGLKIYEKRTTNTGRTTLAKNVAGYLVILFSGTAGATPAAGDKGDTWPILSAGVPREYVSGATAAKWTAALVITARPSEDAVLV